MHYFLFPEKDATIIEASSSMNTGMDEVLEIRKNVSDTGASVDVSRILMKFDLTYISESIVSNLITNPKYYLNLYDAKPQALATSQSLYAYPVSGSWNMGTGHTYDNPQVKDGASWKYRYSSTEGTLWHSQVSSSGGVWWSGSGFEASHSFGHQSRDMRMNVTQLVNQWLSGSIVNDGFMIKRSGSIGNNNPSASEGSTERLGSFSFFSSNTHTIYPPTL